MINKYQCRNHLFSTRWYPGLWFVRWFHFLISMHLNRFGQISRRSDVGSSLKVRYITGEAPNGRLAYSTSIYLLLLCLSSWSFTLCLAIPLNAEIAHSIHVWFAGLRLVCWFHVFPSWFLKY